MKISGAVRLKHKIRRDGLVTPRSLARGGIARDTLYKAYKRGEVERVGRGLYALPGAAPSPWQSYLEAQKRTPEGVVSLLSALQFHGLTTQAPREVWLAIGNKARKPSSVSPPLRVVRFSGLALIEGVEKRRVKASILRVYSPAKTVADCFKYRNKIGLDVALEALRDCLRQKKCTRDELWEYARIDRVANVMRPYLEALS